MPDWRDEVCTALDFWIAAEGGGGNPAGRLICVGRARPANEPGWYDVDLRGSTVSTDQTESFRLSGKNGPDAGPSYPVMEAAQDGPLARVRVAEFVNLPEPYLWQNKQPATHLLVKLRDGIAGLTEAGLAHDLAAGRLAPTPTLVRPVAGFTPRQREAYESCLGTGVRLVWGPPGTGKTKVLSTAIGALLATGMRVLLVSATNIAVDNALLGVVGHRRHRPGELLRVGSPHHPDVLEHPDVCLPSLVRAQLSEVEQQRQAIETQLLRMRQADEELVQLQEAIADFDPQEYDQAVQLIAAEAAIPRLAGELAAAVTTAHSRRRDAERRCGDVASAETRVREFAKTRRVYAEIDHIERELAEVAAAADALSARALTAMHAADRIMTELDRQDDGTLFSRLRRRSREKQLKGSLVNAQQVAGHLERRAHDARELVIRRRLASAERVRQLAASTVCSRSEVIAADAALDAARQAHAQAERLAKQAEDDADRRQQALLAAEARPAPTEVQRALVENVKRRQLPALAERAAVLRSQITAAKPERARLEDAYAKVHERFDRLRKDAEGEIIRRAQLVATTLARLRTSKALMEGPYDVVLIDEVSAATLPEALLAVSRAKRAAVLLGDFLQLGAVVHNTVEQARRPDVQRWLRTNVFEHCGIRTAHDAQRHEGCTALDVQHRFGPEIMRLANAIAYDGLLKPGPNVRPHANDDPEIVLIDTDGLGDIGRVRTTKRRSGWWPAGALLGRVLADYHRTLGERSGIVTPYTHQAQAHCP